MEPNIQSIVQALLILVGLIVGVGLGAVCGTEPQAMHCRCRGDDTKIPVVHVAS